MPCIYEESPEEKEAYARLARDAAEAEKERQRTQKRELDRATRLLCDVCTRLERASVAHKLASDILRDSELSEWWKTHKAADKARRAREASKAKKRAEKAKAKKAKAKLRETAIVKLTAAERKALGL